MISHVVGLQCFIAMELVNWLLEYVEGIESRQQAVKFSQVSFMSTNHTKLKCTTLHAQASIVLTWPTSSCIILH